MDRRSRQIEHHAGYTDVIGIDVKEHAEFVRSARFAHSWSMGDKLRYRAPSCNDGSSVHLNAADTCLRSKCSLRVEDFLGDAIVRRNRKRHGLFAVVEMSGGYRMSAQSRYGEGNPNRTWSIGKFERIRTWVNADPSRSFRLFASRVESALGVRDHFWYGGPGNYRHEVWPCEHEGLRIWVLSSKLGVTYEFESPETPWNGSVPDKDLDKVIGFLAQLCRQIEAAVLAKNGVCPSSDGLPDSAAMSSD